MADRVPTKQKRYFRIVIGMGFLMLVLYLYDCMIYRRTTELPAKACETNTDAALYEDEEQLLILKLFKPLSHLTKDDMIILPGLKATKTQKENQSQKSSICTSMTPQGLCRTENYVLVSAYCSAHMHNSVIYVMDNKTKYLEKVVVLKDKNHVGGLAYDDLHQIIWVTSECDNAAAVSAIRQKALHAYEGEEPISYVYEYEIPDLKQSSFLAYSDSELFIGEFAKEGYSILQKYTIGENGELNMNSWEKWRLPARIQGIAIWQDYYFLTQSYGWSPSFLMVYRRKEKELKFIGKMKLPQKLQQLEIDSGKMYLLFESAAYIYRTQPLPKVDRILILKFDEVRKYFEMEKLWKI